MRALKGLEELNARFSEVNDERTTLDGTCASLLERIRELESVKGDFESLEEDHSSVMSTSRRLRRVRLLGALERWNWKRRQSGGLESFLSQLGADTPRARRQVLTALVSAQVKKICEKSSVRSIECAAYARRATLFACVHTPFVNDAFIVVKRCRSLSIMQKLQCLSGVYDATQGCAMVARQPTQVCVAC